MSKIYEPFKLKNLNLKNRIVMPPMCMYTSEDGMADQWHLVHYGSRAIGGVGMIIVEATGVTPEGRITSGDLGLWKDEQIDGLKDITDFLRKNDCASAIQLNHAGRKSEINMDCGLAPSEHLYEERLPKPKAMTTQDIERVVEAFKESTIRARHAGFDAVEIHGAHGFLLSEFLSPITNIRTDDYGGSLENRYRFLKEVITAIRTEWPEDRVLILRLSADEYHEDGSNLEEKIEIARMAREDGVDMVHVSTGGIVNVPIDVYPGYQVKHSEEIRRLVDVPTIAGGLLTSESQLEEVIGNLRADLVFVGREMLYDPYFSLKTRANKDEANDWPQPYAAAKR